MPHADHAIQGQRAPGKDPRSSDSDLMRRVAANDQAAVGELYDRFGSLVFKMSVQAMPSRPEAEDAVQEVFVRLWRTADKFDAEKAALVTWVMLLTRRHLVDRMRRRRSRVRAVSLEAKSQGANGRGGGEWLSGEDGVGTDRLVEDERFAAVMKRVKTLPALQQTVVIRSYLGGQTLRQIADELGSPLGTVKSALSRALVRLREQGDEEVQA